MTRLAQLYSGVPFQERLITGGALVPYNPVQASLGYLTDPKASYQAYGSRQVQDLLTKTKSGQLFANAQSAIAGSPRLAGALSLGGKALPWLPVAGNVLEGDLVGTASSVGGGLIGGALTLGNPWGIAAGAALGEPIVRGGINLAAGIAGMDPNDPLSGPDWRIPIPGGKDPDGRDNDIAITPYAKYLKREGREFDAVRRQYERLAPIREELRQADLSRQMQVAAMGQMGQMRAQSANMLQSMITGGY